jgi:predicted phosphodiesterase
MAIDHNSEWVCSETNERVAQFVTQIPKSSGTFKILALTDLHWDSAHCKLDLLKSHLDEALKKNIPVIIIGDLYDVMQGKYDPRSDQSTLREEHRGNCYFDAIIDTSIDWFRPYAKIMALVSPGNHEGAVMKRQQIDLIDRFCRGMKSEGSNVISAPDWGFILVKMKNRNTVNTKKLYYQHGYGGGGEITRGLIDHSRTRSQWDADVYVSGHIHRRNIDENIIVRCSARGTVSQEQQLFVRCGSYKDETHDAWHISKGRGARPVGGWYINFNAKIVKSDLQVSVSAEPTS